VKDVGQALTFLCEVEKGDGIVYIKVYKTYREVFDDDYSQK
jgi:hypothetical protein